MNNWYSPITDNRTGMLLTGAAAMNYRVWLNGGMDNIVRESVEIGFQTAMDKFLVQTPQNKKPNLKLVG